MRILVLTLLALVALWVEGAGTTSEAAGNSLGQATAIAVSGTHSCVLMAEGDVRCWGTNGDGRLGDGTIAMRVTPASVVGLEGEVVDLIAGGFVAGRTCAVMQSNDILCWGAGALGTDLTDRCPSKLFRIDPLERPVTNVLSDTIIEFPCSTSPEPLTIVDGKVLDLAMGSSHTCALLEEDNVICWGSNRGGQLGVPQYDEEGDFTEVRGLEGGVASLTAGYEHSCALMEAGTVKCWGNNRSLVLGNITDDLTSGPVDVCWRFDETVENCVDVLQGVVSVEAGGSSGTCAVLEDQSVVCWGRLAPRQPTPDPEPDCFREPMQMGCYRLPATIEGLASPVVELAVAANRGCALLASGRVNCWGVSAFGMLGDGWTCGVEIPTYCNEPVQVCVEFDFEGGMCLAPLTEVVAIDTGHFHTCALKADGAVLCWGSSTWIGDGGACRSPSPERLAEAEHLQFCSIAVPVVGFVLGDVDRDGRVNSVDATLILQLEAALIGTISSPGGADLNSDGLVDSVDAHLVLALEAGIKTVSSK